MDECDDQFLEAQRKALAKFESTQPSDGLLNGHDAESIDLARAIAASDYEYGLTSQHHSEKVATELQNSELSLADKELAKAIETSQNEADVETDSATLEISALRQKRVREEDRNEGSWDCLACTYTNVPYRQKCALCCKPAPSNVLTFKKLSNIRFGLEIEIIVPDGKHDGHTLETIAQNLTRLGPKVEFVGYSHRTSNNWKLVTDNSLQSLNGRDRDLCFELVSPVLQGEGPTGLGYLRAIMDSVRRLGIAIKTSCGFHVHVDASCDSDQAQPEMGILPGLQRVAQCFTALENAFDLLVALTWDKSNHVYYRRTNCSKYCKSNRMVFGERSNRQRWEMIASTSSLLDLVNLINPHHDRHRKLNLTNIVKPNRPSTCEFRHHGGVEELREAEAWVRLILRFCEKCSIVSHKSSACLLREGATPKEELKTLFFLLDCEGLEQFFTLERKLYVEQRLNNEWECGLCRRQFQNSRSLSQHIEATKHFHSSIESMKK